MSDAKELPEGMTCGDCTHWPRCLAFICTLSPSNTWCDFAPSRFVEAGGHLKASRALVEKLTRERDDAHIALRCERATADETARQRDEAQERRDRLAYYLRIFIHAHEMDRAVPPGLEAEAIKAVDGLAVPCEGADGGGP